VNVVNNLIGENCVNLINFLNNECVNIYVTWYQLYNFILGGKGVNILDFNYKKEWNVLFNNQIISCDYSKPFIIGVICGFLYRNMPKDIIHQGSLFRKLLHKLTRSVNT